jgi:hypothetical protein
MKLEMVEKLTILEGRKQFIVLKVVIRGTPTKMSIINVITLFPLLPEINNMFD